MTRKDENDTDPATAPATPNARPHAHRDSAGDRSPPARESAERPDETASIESLLQGFDGRIVDPPVNARSSAGQDVVVYSAGPQSAPSKNETPVPLPAIMISRTPVPPARAGRAETDAPTVVSPPRGDGSGSVTVLTPEHATERASDRPKKIAAFLGALAVVAIGLLGLVKRADRNGAEPAASTPSPSVSPPSATPPEPPAVAIEAHREAAPPQAEAPPVPSASAPPQAVAPKAQTNGPRPRASATAPANVPTESPSNLDIPRATDLWSAPRHDAP